jgi:hypothetical protein
MCDAISANGMGPAMDRAFAFDQAKAAFSYMERGTLREVSRSRSDSCQDNGDGCWAGIRLWSRATADGADLIHRSILGSRSSEME